MRLALLLALTASACAQPTPDADRQRRADSAITRASDVPSAEAMPGDRPDDGTEAGEVAPLVEHVVPLGEGTVTVRVRTVAGGGPALNALNLHDDESTSVEAAQVVAEARGGRVVELAHTGERHVTFALAGRTYVADPNRVFTAAGRARTLASLSQADPAADAALAAFADSVLAIYTAVRPQVVITLHNNTPDRYSARSYLPGAEYASDAAAVTVRPGSDADDFFFVTDRPLYEALVARGFNAVLQDNDAATDDGSLSVWAAREGVPYVNVEAEHGHRAQQAAMIDALLDVLAERP